MHTSPSIEASSRSDESAAHVQPEPWRAALARVLRLPPPRFSVACERDIPITMPDGVVLLADRYWPRSPGPYPTVLIRTPYGRGLEAPGFTGRGMIFAAQRFAERGYAVVVQTVRGRFDSGGVFDPRVNEPSDGRATMEWIAAQPWFGGALGMWGASYLGFVQWAVAMDPPPYLKALAPSITSAQPAPRYHAHEPLAFLSLMQWLHTLGERPPSGWRAYLYEMRRRDPKQLEAALAPALAHLPLGLADELVGGKPVAFYRDILQERPVDDAYWQARDFRAGLARLRVPVSLLGGWYDIFLPDILADYLALRAGGQRPALTIGPWTHVGADTMLASLREGLRWFAIHLQGDTTQLDTTKERQQTVRLYLMGAREWREFADWPPPARESAFFLHEDGYLSLDTPDGEQPPDRYRYDPADPTPSLGGPVLLPPAGPVDNRPLEARRDVLRYTSEPLRRDLEVIGPVRLALYVRSSVEYTDFVGRLCDVSPSGRSINICDGIVRIVPGIGERQTDGTLRIEVDMWATAQRFARGHRLRLLVSSGGHPRWLRNLGTGEPAASATHMVVADQAIYHDAAHPSALILPVVHGL
jgi:putative CocE/NonD family hydrolase